jgi:hypothetical protein
MNEHEFMKEIKSEDRYYELLEGIAACILFSPDESNHFETDEEESQAFYSTLGVLVTKTDKELLKEATYYGIVTPAEEM